MLEFKCPYSKKLREHEFLLCSAFMKDGVNYGNGSNAVQAICLQQYFCRMKGSWINTENANACYLKQKEKLNSK